jgi:hypothetical protein
MAEYIDSRTVMKAALIGGSRFSVFLAVLKQQVDVVNIVRCGECKWYGGSWGADGVGYCISPKAGCGYTVLYRKPDDFCSYGERKESDDHG